MLTKNYLIVVAVDGSEVSMNAVDYAVELAKHEQNSLLILLNILSIGTAKEVLRLLLHQPTVWKNTNNIKQKLSSGWMKLR